MHAYFPTIEAIFHALQEWKRTNAPEGYEFTAAPDGRGGWTVDAWNNNKKHLYTETVNADYRNGNIVFTISNHQGANIMAIEQTPTHLAPQSCYVCGLDKENHTNTTHTFWTNADATKEFAQQPQNTVNVESNYISQHRPY
jgi:hypothetical protein